MMARVLSFFESQAESTEALDALYAGDYGDVDTQVIETGREAAAGEVFITATPHDTYTAHPAGAVAFPGNLYDLDFETDEEATWFNQSARNHGVIVIAKVDDEHADSVHALFRDRGGRVFQKA